MSITLSAWSTRGPELAREGWKDHILPRCGPEVLMRTWAPSVCHVHAGYVVYLWNRGSSHTPSYNISVDSSLDRPHRIIEKGKHHQMCI